MNKQRILEHSFVLGHWAGENKREENALKDSVFIEFLNTQTSDTDFRVDCFEQWYKGWNFGIKGAIMR